MPSLLLHQYPELFPLDAAGEKIIKLAHKLQAPAGSTLFRQGDRCDNFIMVTSGRIKVVAHNHTGREIVLYRIEDKGTCVLTTSCLLGKLQYPAEGVAETNITAYLLPKAAFEQALDQSPDLRQFIFATYANPLSDVIELVQNIAFESVETRLVEYLIAHTDSTMIIERSHQEIANELGSAREVISRQLKRLEQQGIIKLQRGKLHICDFDQLCSVT
ncbi:MAG: Crp/Fnr family transcriptional regulator [Neptuniibacter sp.]